MDKTPKRTRGTTEYVSADNLYFQAAGVVSLVNGVEKRPPKMTFSARYWFVDLCTTMVVCPEEVCP